MIPSWNLVLALQNNALVDTSWHHLCNFNISGSHICRSKNKYKSLVCFNNRFYLIQCVKMFCILCDYFQSSRHFIHRTALLGPAVFPFSVTIELTLYWQGVDSKTPRRCPNPWMFQSLRLRLKICKYPTHLHPCDLNHRWMLRIFSTMPAQCFMTVNSNLSFVSETFLEFFSKLISI